MDQEQNKQKKTIVIILSIIVLALVVWGYQAFSNRGEGEEKIPTESLSLEEVANPFDQELSNPLEGSSNPYEDIKTNPFE